MQLPEPPKSLLPGQGRGFEKFYEASQEISALEMGQGIGVWGEERLKLRTQLAKQGGPWGLSLLPLQADQLFSEQPCGILPPGIPPSYMQLIPCPHIMRFVHCSFEGNSAATEQV